MEKESHGGFNIKIECILYDENINKIYREVE